MSFCHNVTSRYFLDGISGNYVTACPTLSQLNCKYKQCPQSLSPIILTDSHNYQHGATEEILYIFLYFYSVQGFSLKTIEKNAKKARKPAWIGHRNLVALLLRFGCAVAHRKWKFFGPFGLLNVPFLKPCFKKLKAINQHV